MFSEWRRRRKARKVKPGDGHPLPRFRWWQLLSRSLFLLERQGSDGAGSASSWAVDVRIFGDSNGEVWANLYLDGRHYAASKMPARFAIPGGAIEVVASGYGLKRCHFVDDDGTARQLTPHRSSAEGLRARLDRRHPVLSRGIGVLSLLVLLVALVLGVPQLIEQITQIPPIAERIGTFSSPIALPAWFNITLVIAALVASTERALRLRYHWLLDGGLFEGDD